MSREHHPDSEILATIIPKEIIHRRDGTIISYEIGAKTPELAKEAVQMLEVISDGEGVNLTERGIKSTSTLGIDYNHPMASPYFKNKEWNPSNN